MRCRPVWVAALSRRALSAVIRISRRVSTLSSTSWQKPEMADRSNNDMVSSLFIPRQMYALFDTILIIFIFAGLISIR